ncbi:MAG TPA: GspMb/PilO family protein [Alphaproteobacteria bacterium]|jgi:Tfp pilus assembly protein PilO|nr:GspMb/PilO family protein [Alphaproteobacteria bacterium]
MPKNFKLILNSTLPLIVVIILFLLVGKFGISKILEIQSQISDTRTRQTVLTQKLSLLQNLSETVSTGSNVSLSALPDTNPALLVVSQLKNISSASGVTLSGLKSGAEVLDPSGISKVGISFNVTGTRDTIIAFLKTIQDIAPITVVDKVKINQAGEETTASVTVQSFWADLPKTLPKLDQPITDLTEAEKKTLTDIENLIQPNFADVAPSETSGKEDPFSR